MALFDGVPYKKKKTKIIITTAKENTVKSQRKLEVKTTKLLKARENAGDQVLIGFSFASDWLH